MSSCSSLFQKSVNKLNNVMQNISQTLGSKSNQLLANRLSKAGFRIQ